MEKVDLSRIPAFYHKYIAYVQEYDLNAALEHHQHDFISLLLTLPEDGWMYRYAEGKWSIKELVQHVIDAERIFCYRALRFARKDKTELPGFEENDFAMASKADSRTKASLIEELAAVQKASALLFASFDAEQRNESGKANGSSVYVEGIGFIIVGHTLHHKNILKERYLQEKTIPL